VLVQCQGIVVGFLASLCGLAMGWLPSGGGHYEHALLLCASAIVTASLASFALALVMIVVIVGARRCNCNPDNIATRHRWRQTLQLQPGQHRHPDCCESW